MWRAGPDGLFERKQHHWWQSLSTKVVLLVLPYVIRLEIVQKLMLELQSALKGVPVGTAMLVRGVFFPPFCLCFSNLSSHNLCGLIKMWSTLIWKLLSPYTSIAWFFFCMIGKMRNRLVSALDFGYHRANIAGLKWWTLLSCKGSDYYITNARYHVWFLKIKVDVFFKIRKYKRRYNPLQNFEI